MACSRLSSMTSVMVSRILKWLLSHIRLGRDMERDWARLGSTVEKKFGVGSKQKENQMRRREKENGKKKNLHYPVAAAKDCCMRWPDAHRLDYLASQRSENKGLETGKGFGDFLFSGWKSVFLTLCFWLFLFFCFLSWGTEFVRPCLRFSFYRYPELSLLGLDRLRVE